MAHKGGRFGLTSCVSPKWCPHTLVTLQFNCKWAFEFSFVILKIKKSAGLNFCLDLVYCEWSVLVLGYKMRLCEDLVRGMEF